MKIATILFAGMASAMNPILFQTSCVATPIPCLVGHIAHPLTTIGPAVTSSPLTTIGPAVTSSPLAMIPATYNGGTAIALLIAFIIDMVQAAACTVASVAVELAEAVVDVVVDMATQTLEEIENLADDLSDLLDSSEDDIEEDTDSSVKNDADKTDETQQETKSRTDELSKAVKEFCGTVGEVGSHVDEITKALSLELTTVSKIGHVTHSCSNSAKIADTSAAVEGFANYVLDKVKVKHPSNTEELQKEAIAVAKGALLKMATKRVSKRLSQGAGDAFNSCFKVGSDLKDTFDDMKKFAAQLKKYHKTEHSRLSATAVHIMCMASNNNMPQSKNLVCHNNQNGNRIQRRNQRQSASNLAQCKNNNGRRLNSLTPLPLKQPNHQPSNYTLHPSSNDYLPCGCDKKLVKTEQDHLECIEKTVEVAHLDISKMKIWKDHRNECRTNNETLIWHACVVEKDHVQQLEEQHGVKYNLCNTGGAIQVSPYGFPNISVSAHYDAQTPEAHALSLNLFIENIHSPHVIAFAQEPPATCDVTRISNVIYLKDEESSPHFQTKYSLDVCTLINHNVSCHSVKTKYQDNQCCENDANEIQISEFVPAF